ncbi:RNA-directed DNA polymerase, eukaryota, Reverse transcriptase zinc-binding domain protein [Artemisia annua]|uniref:RNA-directed DNA polymerase, eukaryota, Reverse transcriptase zinc-binding domain protein n=1 Tax=Artemisia annua TaxID=35608 RepID=A0A2U1KX24_ARTAN|nr:RNA-directed DNA polymerase, eukaryota, Reverse transcriptase zinc-binding domain protein [Artemisia annua]
MVRIIGTRTMMIMVLSRHLRWTSLHMLTLSCMQILWLLINGWPHTLIMFRYVSYNTFCIGSSSVEFYCRPVGLCVNWFCWFCSGTGLWRCNFVFERGEGMYCNLLCTTKGRVASCAGHQLVVWVLRWLCTTGTDSNFCAGILFWFKQFQMRLMSNETTWITSLYMLSGAVSDALVMLSVGSYLDKLCLDLFCFTDSYYFSPIFKLSIYAFYGLYVYGDVWNSIGWSLWNPPCIQSTHVVLDQAVFISSLKGVNSTCSSPVAACEKPRDDGVLLRNSGHVTFKDPPSQQHVLSLVGTDLSKPNVDTSIIDTNVKEQDSASTSVLLPDKFQAICDQFDIRLNTRRRRPLWDNLGLHNQLVRNRPWCVLGDFYSSLNLVDKVEGSSVIDITMREFKECVDANELVDINRSGLQFTWTQKPGGLDGTLRKIDRVMANLGFLDSFAGAHAIFQPYRVSDHYPAILHIPTMLHMRDIAAAEPFIELLLIVIGGCYHYIIGSCCFSFMFLFMVIRIDVDMNVRVLHFLLLVMLSATGDR